MHNSMLISAIRGREGLLLVFSGRGSQMIGEVTDSELKMSLAAPSSGQVQSSFGLIGERSK